MTGLLPFFLILVAGLFFSKLFSRLHVPWVVALILAGILVGPYGFNILAADSTIDFFAEIGLVFLMFMAGLEVRLKDLRELGGKVIKLSLLNAFLPFAVGIGISFYFNLGWVAALLVGIIFMSSSIAVVIPALSSTGLIRTGLGKSIVAATVAEDIFSLVALSVLLQVVSPVTRIPLPLFYPLLFFALFALRWLAPKIHWLFHAGKKSGSDLFEQELRAIVTLILGSVVIFQLLGLHPIIAGFFTGFVLAESLTREVIKEKLHAIAYGIFIPVFFVAVGLKTDIGVFVHTSGAILLTGAIIIGSIGSKFFGGWLGGRLSGFTKTESSFIGASTIPQLSTTLAAVFTAYDLSLLEKDVVTALVMLSIITTLLAPVAIRIFSRKTDIANA